MSRCSYCGDYGHNRRTCAHRPQKSKDFDKQWMRKAGRKAGTQTQCSYCGLYGHNRRTCVHLKRKKAQALSCIEGSVRRALSAFQEYGLGVGAMHCLPTKLCAVITLVHLHASFLTPLSICFAVVPAVVVVWALEIFLAHLTILTIS